MITLKDIKISRNRIPLQNALWIRPMGGFVFKIYYPHGGDWAELLSGGSSPTPSPDTDELTKRISTLEIKLEELTNLVNVMFKEGARTRLRIDGLVDRVDGLSKNVEKLYTLVYADSIDLTSLPPFGIGNSDVDLSKYGIDSTELDRLVNKEITKASVDGYDEAFKVTTVRSEYPSAMAPPWLAVTMILKEGTKRTIIFVMGTTVQLIGGPLQLRYQTWTEEDNIDDSTLYILNSIEKKEYVDIREENLTDFGLSTDDVTSILDGTVKYVLFGDSYIKYTVSDISGEEESRAFSFYGYDVFNNKTDVYYFTGTYNNGWLYDINYEALEGDQVPEI